MVHDFVPIVVEMHVEVGEKHVVVAEMHVVVAEMQCLCAIVLVDDIAWHCSELDFVKVPHCMCSDECHVAVAVKTGLD